MFDMSCICSAFCWSCDVRAFSCLAAGSRGKGPPRALVPSGPIANQRVRFATTRDSRRRRDPRGGPRANTMQHERSNRRPPAHCTAAARTAPASPRAVNSTRGSSLNRTVSRRTRDAAVPSPGGVCESTAPNGCLCPEWREETQPIRCRWLLARRP